MRYCKTTSISLFFLILRLIIKTLFQVTLSYSPDAFQSAHPDNVINLDHHDSAIGPENDPTGFKRLSKRINQI